MKMFHIESSQNSPDVRIDGQDGIMEISGNSTFEKPYDFYRQLAKWLHAFHKDAKDIQTVNIKFSELDQASSRWMIFLLKEVEKISSDRNQSVTVNWFYNGSNELIRVTGENYRTQIKLPFNLIAA